MPFCNVSQELINNGYTLVENAFIRDYLVDAPPKCADVYLYGLYLCSLSSSFDNSLTTMMHALSLEEDDLLTAYTYWEELGLVHIAGKKPFEIVYLPIKTDATLLKRIKPSKYQKFNKEIQNVIGGRMIGPNEFNEYYIFLETTLFEPEALVRVAQYCADLKGDDINYPYILTVARNLNGNDVKTLEKVNEKLDSHSKYTDDVLFILKAMSIKRSVDFDDRRLYEKWTEGYGFTFDVILSVAKQTKKGGINKLDGKLEKYFRLKLLSVKEIDVYEKQRAKLYDLTYELNRIMGLYYSSVDYIVEDYVSPWISKGFDGDALKLTAKYCFTHNIRTFDGLNQTVEKFYKLGLISADAIVQYTNAVVSEDDNIRKVLDELGLVRIIASTDRTCYKNWTKNWGFNFDVILYAAQLSKAAANPMSYLNKILSEFKTKNITTSEQAKKSGGTPQKQEKSTFQNHQQRTYTAEQLNALFDNLDDLDEPL
jgi:DnaD/phage-associated family protein